MTPQIGLNDAVLILSLLYLSVDIQYEWEGFSTCHQPIHKWLLVSYGLIVVSRLIYIAGTLFSIRESGDFLLNLRQKSAGLRILSSLTWLILVPFFTFWSALGTHWIAEIRANTPECLPTGVHLWFLVVWQILSYMWIMIHCGLGAVAWFLEYRLRNAEGNLQQIEDFDVLARWGPVSQLQGYTSLPCSGAKGLSAKEINGLPCACVPENSCAEKVTEECPICLICLAPGDAVRQLGSCGHTFHRPCIDLWLLRRAECPLCKRKVKGGQDGKGWDV